MRERAKGGVAFAIRGRFILPRKNHWCMSMTRNSVMKTRRNLSITEDLLLAEI